MNVSIKRFYRMSVVICLAGYIWLIFSFFESDKFYRSGIYFCWFKRLTTIPCPSCGSTRTAVALMKGDIFNALHWNPLGILWLTLLAILPFWLISDFVFRRNTLLQAYRGLEELMCNRKYMTIGGILIAVNWVWSIFKGL